MAPYTPRNPLVLTLTLDKTSHTFLTSLRAKHFPPNLNHLSAHVTLFHAIPAQRIAEVDGLLKSLCGQTSGWEVFIGEPRKMGTKGVMVTVRERPSGQVESIHSYLLQQLKHNVKEEKDRLTDQDARSMGKPHVTVMNKAKSEEDVEKCLVEVQQTFEGMKQPGQKVGQQKGRAVGLELWEYMGGPWKPLRSYWFQGETPHESVEPAKTA